MLKRNLIIPRDIVRPQALSNQGFSGTSIAEEAGAALEPVRRHAHKQENPVANVVHPKKPVPMLLAPNALHEHRTSHILYSVPMVGDPALDGFFGEVFADRSLCDAYLLVMPDPVLDTAHPVPGMQSSQATLALNLSVTDMNAMLNHPELQKHERRVGAIAAFFAPSGWYLHLDQCDPHRPNQRADVRLLRALRMEALRYPLRALRKRCPAVAATLQAVWDLEDHDDVDADQVERIRKAVVKVCGWL